MENQSSEQNKYNDNNDNNDKKLKLKPGILRLDISKPRRSSGSSVEFRSKPELFGDVSPSCSEIITTTTTTPAATSPQQLSVKWATEPDKNELEFNKQSNISPSSLSSTRQQQQQQQQQQKMPSSRLKSPLERGGSKTKSKIHYDDKMNELSTDMTSPLSDENNSEDEDYSLSVSAIMQRRASHRRKGRRGSRRPSSPMDQLLPDTIGIGGSHKITDRRRSSVYTTSSGDTAISIDDATNQDSSQEQIYENIRLHKEVIQSVKYQPWSMRRKLRLVRQAKTYIARHEGELQERFAMSRSTKDLWARFKIVMAGRWIHFKRELASFLIVLIPWELRIKQIESHFGSGVASYFTFLRWLLWVNIMISIPLCSFVIIPEFFATDYSVADDRKTMTPEEMKIAGKILTIWELEGYLKYSPLFYGYYTDQNDSGAIKWGYNLPLAYFLTSVTVYIYSFVAILSKMADNSRMSKLSSKDDECIFTWKLFTGWDFMIGHAETAHNRIASVVVGFKESLLEEAEKKKDKRNWRIVVQRLFINILIMGLLAASGYTVVMAVNRSETAGPNANWLRRNEVNVIMTLLSFFLPMIFEALGLCEGWHPRKQLRLQLARIMILNLLNLYSLMFSFIYKISAKDKSLQMLKDMHGNITVQKEYYESMLNRTKQYLFTTISSTLIENENSSTDADNETDIVASTTSYMLESLVTTDSAFTRTQCFAIPVICSKSNAARPITNISLTTSLMFLNLTSTLLPTFTLTTAPDSGTGTTTVTGAGTSSTTEYTTFSYEYLGNDSYFEYYDYFDNIGKADFPDSNSDIKKLVSGLKYSKESNRQIRQIKPVDYYNEHEGYTTVLPVKRDDIEVIFKNSSNKYDKILHSTTETASTTTTSNYNTQEPITSNKIFTTTTQLPPFTTTTDTTTTTPASTISTVTTTTIDKNFTTEQIPDVTTQINENFNASTPVNVIVNGTVNNGPEEIFIRNGTNLNKGNNIIFVDGDPLQYDESGNCTKIICVIFKEDVTPISTTPITVVNTRTLEQDKEYYEHSLNNVSKILANIRKNLTNMCWETSLGQELSKVIVFDAVMSIAATLCIDYFRALFVRYMNDHWCWDMEKTFPQYGDFKIAESILNLVYNQGQVWMGIFFSPGLVIINLIKLLIFMYLRSWIVLTCNVPHEVVFKASKSNNFYLALLLTMLFLCVLPVSFSIVWLRPSWHCGPYTNYNRVSEFFTITIKKAFKDNETWYKPLEYLTSASTVIPLMLLLILIIYYLISLTGALREANQDLKVQLQKERMEERRKMLKLPEQKPTEQSDGGITSRWKMVLDAASTSPTDRPAGQTAVQPEVDEAKNQARRDLLTKLMKKALRKASITSEEDSILPRYNEDDTDTDRHDSLPHDEEIPKKQKSRRQINNPSRTRKPDIMDIVQLAKKENTNREQHPRGKFKVNKNVLQSDENDAPATSRTTAERRKSLLKRQSKISESLDSQPEIEDQDINYKVINEKNKQMEKKSNGEPKVFIFEGKSTNNRKQCTEMRPEKPHSRKSSVRSEDTKTHSTNKKKLSSDNFYGKHQEHETSPNEDTSPPSPAAEMMATLSKGRRKIGSFLTLVKEAVNTKRTDGHHTEKFGCIDAAIASPTTSAFEIESPNAEEMSTEPEEIDSRKESSKSAKKQPPKRQDSQASIWSEKLPTITISKTEGEECILECSEKDNNGETKNPPNDEVNH